MRWRVMMRSSPASTSCRSSCRSVSQAFIRPAPGPSRSVTTASSSCTMRASRSATPRSASSRAASAAASRASSAAAASPFPCSQNTASTITSQPGKHQNRPLQTVGGTSVHLQGGHRDAPDSACTRTTFSFKTAFPFCIQPLKHPAARRRRVRGHWRAAACTAAPAGHERGQAHLPAADTLFARGLQLLGGLPVQCLQPLRAGLRSPELPHRLIALRLHSRRLHHLSEAQTSTQPIQHLHGSTNRHAPFA